jgi:hypothetical protein
MLKSGILDRNKLFNDDPVVMSCIELKTKLDQNMEKIQAAKTKIQVLKERSDGFRKNLGSISNMSASNYQEKWLLKLASAGDEITNIEDTILPELEKETVVLRSNLNNEILKINVSWKK